MSKRILVKNIFWREVPQNCGQRLQCTDPPKSMVKGMYPRIKGHIGSTPLKIIHKFLTPLKNFEYLVEPPKKDTVFGSL